MADRGLTLVVQLFVRPGQERAVSSDMLSQYDIDRLLGGAGSAAVAPASPSSGQKQQQQQEEQEVQVYDFRRPHRACSLITTPSR